MSRPRRPHQRPLRLKVEVRVDWVNNLVINNEARLEISRRLHDTPPIPRRIGEETDMVAFPRNDVCDLRRWGTVLRSTARSYKRVGYRISGCRIRDQKTDVPLNTPISS